MQKWLLWICSIIIVFGFLGGDYKMISVGAGILIIFFGVKIIFGGAKLTAKATSNAINTKLRDAREEKEFQKNLRREVQREEALGMARNKASLELMREQTESLIRQIKAGGQVQNELRVKYQEITSLGDKSFDDMKKEIQALSSNKKLDFKL